LPGAHPSLKGVGRRAEGAFGLDLLGANHRVIGLSQSDISRIGRMKTDGFSQERMQYALRQLGMDVEIRLHHRKNGGIGTLKVLKLA
jgi:hypothetical protein